MRYTYMGPTVPYITYKDNGIKLLKEGRTYEINLEEDKKQNLVWVLFFDAYITTASSGVIIHRYRIPFAANIFKSYWEKAQYQYVPELKV